MRREQIESGTGSVRSYNLDLFYPISSSLWYVAAVVPIELSVFLLFRILDIGRTVSCAMVIAAQPA